MTVTSRLDAALTQWLTEEAAVAVPERLVHQTRLRIAATPQRRVIRAPALLRSITSSAIPDLALLGVLILAVVSLSVYLRSTGPAESPPPSASPTPTPAPTLSAVQPYECQRSRGTCLGPLNAGVYETTTFQPRIRFSVPAGWSSLYDVPGQYDLFYDAGGQYTYPDGVTFHDRLSIFASPLAESQTVGAPIPGVGTLAAELASWLASHEDLVTTAPKAVSIGGAMGFVVEISLPTGARSAPDHCTTDHAEPRCESLFVGADPNANYDFGLFGPESAVVYMLDVPASGTVMLVIDDVDGVDTAGLVRAATPIVESISFAP